MTYFCSESSGKQNRFLGFHYPVLASKMLFASSSIQVSQNSLILNGVAPLTKLHHIVVLLKSSARGLLTVAFFNNFLSRVGWTKRITKLQSLIRLHAALKIRKFHGVGTSSLIHKFRLDNKHQKSSTSYVIARNIAKTQSHSSSVKASVAKKLLHVIIFSKWLESSPTPTLGFHFQ